MKKNIFTVITILMIFSLASCNLGAQITPTISPPTSTPMMLETEIPLPTEEIPLPTMELSTSTPQPTPTTGPVTILSAEVSMDGFSLRSGPGRNFERLDLYDTGAVVNLLGRENSNNWVLVQTANHLSGWMNLVGLNVRGRIDSLPIFEVNNAIVLHGHVTLPGKAPIKGVGVSMTPADVDDPTRHDSCSTNEAGEWALYLPLDTRGPWALAPNSFTCAGPNAMQAPYDCNTSFTLPAPQVVTLPLEQDISIEFEIVPQ